MDLHEIPNLIHEERLRRIVIRITTVDMEVLKVSNYILFDER